MKMCTVSSLVFLVLPNRVRAYPVASTGRSPAGARRLRGAGIRPTVATEPSTVYRVRTRRDARVTREVRRFRR